MEPDVEDRVGRSIAQIRIDPEAWRGPSTEKIRADEGDAMAIQDVGNLLTASLPSGNGYFADIAELRQGPCPVTIGVMGALAGRQDARDRGQTAQHHRESFDNGVAVRFDATGGAVSSCQEDIDVGGITGAIVPELRVLNGKLGDPIEVGDDPAEMSLYCFRPAGPGAFAGDPLVLSGVYL
ncbi:hypothetical protein [Microtetraspora malaysiensis]|uniref:hypothetical protein n=1 Tax=Microtetraspora malaysiensis TaxID=161358 RepID=UPI003D91EBD2